jgi:hypothetical protein
MGRNRNIVKLDKYHYHEALDRTFMIENIATEYLAEHLVIQKHPELRKKVETAIDLLIDVYQEIGRLEFELFPDPKKDSDKQ